MHVTGVPGFPAVSDRLRVFARDPRPRAGQGPRLTRVAVPNGVLAVPQIHLGVLGVLAVRGSLAVHLKFAFAVLQHDRKVS